jgi:hypothetical protein
MQVRIEIFTLDSVDRIATQLVCLAYLHRPWDGVTNRVDSAGETADGRLWTLRRTTRRETMSTEATPCPEFRIVAKLDLDSIPIKAKNLSIPNDSNSNAHLVVRGRSIVRVVLGGLIEDLLSDIEPLGSLLSLKPA